MTSAEGPHPNVLSERISGMSGRLDSIEKRIDNLATKQELLHFISSRDELMTTQVNDLRDDIKNLTAALATERQERMTGDKENEERAGKARTFALSAIGLVVTVVLGLIALINQIGGAPT